MKEATLYKKLENNSVQCTACRHYCKIPLGQTGICGVRQNMDGKLYLLVYGKASAVNIDPIEKKPLFHFLPGSSIFSLGTVGCNFRCDFCQNWDLSQASKELKKKLIAEKKQEMIGIEIGKLGYDLSPEKIVELSTKQNIPSIAYTYNEPTIFFEYLFDTSRLAVKKGLKNIFVTNGYESEESLIAIKPYLHAMNIDLKSFSDAFYQKICGARLQPVLETIKKSHEIGIWIEITTLLIPGKNDSKKELRNIAEFIAGIDKSIPWHITAFHPDYKMLDTPPTSAEKLFEAHKIGKEAGLSFVYVGNILDESHSNTCCPKCNALLIKRNGYSIKIEKLKDGKCSVCGYKVPGVWE